MYYNGQIIYNRDLKRPIVAGLPGDGEFAWSMDYKRTTHFIQSSDGPSKEYEIAMPKTVEEAVDLLEKGLITPAPVTRTHHWKCGNWKSNCRCEDKT